MATIQTTTYSSITDTAAITITLDNLAASSTLLAGRASTAVANTSDLYRDVLVFGQITTGTTLTAGQIQVLAIAPLKLASSTYTWPVATATALTGSDEAATWEAGQKAQLRTGAVIATNTTNSRKYQIQPFSLAALFGEVPLSWKVFVTQSSNANLDNTGGLNWLHYTGIKYTAT